MRSSILKCNGIVDNFWQRKKELEKVATDS